MSVRFCNFLSSFFSLVVLEQQLRYFIGLLIRIESRREEWLPKSRRGQSNTPTFVFCPLYLLQTKSTFSKSVFLYVSLWRDPSSANHVSYLFYLLAIIFLVSTLKQWKQQSVPMFLDKLSGNYLVDSRSKKPLKWIALISSTKLDLNKFFELSFNSTV